MAEEDEQGGWRKLSPIHQALLDYFIAHKGQIINGSAELRPLTGNQTEWGRRVRELRTECGYRILTHRDRDTLKSGEYLLETDERLPASRRHISKETRAVVLDRDGSTCQMCGRAAGDPDSYHPGRSVQLTMGHIIPQSQGGSDEPDNLRAICTDCNEGLQDIAPAPPSLKSLFVQIRRATKADQRAIFEWLRLRLGQKG